MSPELAAPGPIRVMTVDLAAPLQVDVGTDQALWAVGLRDGLPVALLEIDRSTGAPTAAEQVATLAAAHPAVEHGWRDLPDSELPSITVVVPSVVRRLEDLQVCLAAIEAQDYPRFDVIVADNRAEVPADDPLRALLANRPLFRSVRIPAPGVGAARQGGWRAATGEIVAFTDDDVRVDRGWLRSFGARFAVDPELSVCTGLILPAELETPAQIYFERYYGGFAGERLFAPLILRTGKGVVGRARLTAFDEAGAVVRTAPIYGVGAYGAGANMALRRRALEQVGGFDVALGTGTPSQGGEDLQIFIDLLWSGGSMRYEPAAFVYHRHRRGYEELVRQLRMGGVGLVATLASLVSRDPRHLAGLALQVPMAAHRLVQQSIARFGGHRVDEPAGRPEQAPLFPRELLKQELRGMPSGPAAYVRSRRKMRRWAQDNPGSAIV